MSVETIVAAIREYEIPFDKSQPVRYITLNDGCFPETGKPIAALLRMELHNLTLTHTSILTEESEGDMTRPVNRRAFLSKLSAGAVAGAFAADVRSAPPGQRFRFSSSTIRA
jgi:hypothetical protein